ncbi:MAG: P-II family nitrogen regulator [Chloroflexi bacterium]|nr:P-II family nitrogen regulator [Chloroflexota bacterium]MCH8816285.1 P-II family nitrogen regulator [Chloroflexota bacterium]
MKLIMAIIQPERLAPVRQALAEVDVTAMTVSEARGFGRQGGITTTYRGAEYRVEYVNKLKLDIVVSEPFYQAAIKAIMEAAHTGKIGDGKIFVLDVEKAYRIRTGEEDEVALN